MARQLQAWAMEAEAILSKQHKRFDFGFRFHTRNQAQGKCPFCAARTGDGGDGNRFVLWEDGNYWCRECDQRGFWMQDRISPAEVEAQRLAKEQERLKLRASISTCADWQRYHAQVTQALQLWEQHGIDQKDIQRWGLGFCSQAPCVDYETPSLTIPVFHKQKLVDIRHRLVKPADGQKYRSHLPNLPPSFLNLDAIGDGGTVYLVEGEKKTIVLEHYGLHPVISYPGVNYGKSLSHILAQEGSKSQQFVFLPDPGTEQKLYPVWKEISKDFRVGVVDLIRKPDDFVVQFGVDALHAAMIYPRWM